MNCQIRGLTSIRKDLGKDHIPFLVDTNSIIVSENKGYRLKIKEVSEKLFLQNRSAPSPEGSCFYKTGEVPIRRGLTFANPEGSQTGGVSTVPIRRGPIFANLEGYCFCQPGRDIILLKDLGK